MKKYSVAKITTWICIMFLMQGVILQAKSESLFQAGVSLNATSPYIPKSLYSTVRAGKIGDIITIIINENLTSSSKLALESSKDSTLTDRFTSVLEEALPGKGLFPDQLDDFGVKNEVKNDGTLSRTSTMKEKITAQIVQVLPNGNLVLQGRKAIINATERQNIVISGIADPRFINSSGQILSTQLANFQVAVTGNGTVSRGQSDGVVNKLLKVLF